MKSLLYFFAFFSLLLFAETITARKDVGEYWRAEPNTEAIEGLVQIDTISSSNDKTKCHTPPLKEEKIIVEDFERSSPDKGDNEKKKLSFADDFEPRPNISAYGDDADLKEEKSSPSSSSSSSSSFAKDFEPRPNIPPYSEDDAGLKGEKKLFTSDFEPRPNISVYHD